MKTIKEIKENPKLEILQTSIDGISGILHHGWTARKGMRVSVL